MNHIKSTLHEICLAIVDSKIADYKQAIEDARAAQQNETKSSAGDKYETTREMMTQEIENSTRQLIAAEAERQLLNHALNENLANGKVHHGSIVKTDTGNFYVAAGIGKVIADEETFQVVSPVSPIGKLLIGKTAADLLEFNGKKYMLKEVV
jgi:transcription elongation GreA/GreB family factor